MSRNLKRQLEACPSPPLDKNSAEADLKSETDENNKKLLGDKFDPKNNPYETNPETKSYHVIDVRGKDSYNKNDPFQFSTQNAETQQATTTEKQKQAPLKSMNRRDHKKISDFEVTKNAHKPMFVKNMYKYSDKALDTLHNVLPAIISVIKVFPHRPTEELHSEMTSTRDYMPPLPDQDIFENLSTSPLGDVRIEPGQHYNYADPAQIMTRGKPVPTWEYNYNEYIPIDLADVRSSAAELNGKNLKSTFQGMFKNGQKECIGHEILETGSGYFGQYKDGQRHGEGRVVLSNGSFYIGEFENNLANGQGMFYNAKTGVRYEGSFKNNTQNGSGKEFYPDHTIYEGDFVANKKSGKGKFIFADGGVYIGDWKENIITGEGKYTYEDGERWYEGEWKNNLKHGRGIYQMGSKQGGALYEGEFVDGKMHGNGIVTW